MRVGSEEGDPVSIPGRSTPLGLLLASTLLLEQDRVVVDNPIPLGQLPTKTLLFVAGSNIVVIMI